MRETLNRKPAVALAVSAVCLALVVWIWFARAKEGRGEQSLTAAKSWYTIDDGRTWFADAPNKVVPFEHQGKQAYRCFVWTCDGGKTKFVSHLERLAPQVRRQFGPQEQVEPWKLPPGGEQVKRPLTGDAGWVDAASPGAGEIQRPNCPGGAAEIPQPVGAG